MSSESFEEEDASKMCEENETVTETESEIPVRNCNYKLLEKMLIENTTVLQMLKAEEEVLHEDAALRVLASAGKVGRKEIEKIEGIIQGKKTRFGEKPHPLNTAKEEEAVSNDFEDLELFLSAIGFQENVLAATATKPQSQQLQHPIPDNSEERICDIRQHLAQTLSPLRQIITIVKEAKNNEIS